MSWSGTRKINRWTFGCWVAFGVLLVLVVAHVLPYRSQNTTQVELVQFVGTYQENDDGMIMPIDKIGPIEAGKDKKLILRGKLSRDINEGEQLLFFIPYLEVHIEYQGEEIFSFSEPGSYPAIMQSLGSSWAHCVLPGTVDSLNDLTITLQSKYDSNFANAYDIFLKSLCVGDSGALARKVIAISWPYILFSVGFLILSAVLLIVALALKLQRIAIHSSVFYCVFFVISVSTWIMLAPRYCTLIMGNTTLNMLLEMITSMMAGVFLVKYVGTLLTTKMKNLNNLLLFILIGFILLYLSLQLLGIVDAFTIRDWLAPLLGAIGLALAAEVGYELSKGKNETIRALVVPGIGMLTFNTLETVNYVIDSFPRGYFACIGFTIFIMAQFILAVKYLSKSLKNAQKTVQLERELADNKIAIMLSQIQPHFLFNSLTAIQQLCVENPPEAEDAIATFARFLRGNIDSLASKNCIFFEQELAHIKAYLALEQIRFQDKLRVVFDIKTADFLIPPLTVQPIIENAVRYGVGKKEEGGTVYITSWEEDENYFITVCDDGVGFDTEKPLVQDNRSHVGIQNVKSRLDAQCSGTLKINSQIGVGTRVTITIPKEI